MKIFCVAVLLVMVINCATARTLLCVSGSKPPSGSTFLPKVVALPSFAEYEMMAEENTDFNLDGSCLYIEYDIGIREIIMRPLSEVDDEKFSVTCEDGIERIVVRGLWIGWDDRIFYKPIYFDGKKPSWYSSTFDEQSLIILGRIEKNYMLAQTYTDDYDVIARSLSKAIYQVVNNFGADIEYET